MLTWRSESSVKGRRSKSPHRPESMRPASAAISSSSPGGAQRSTCAFLQGILYKIGNAGAAEKIEAIFENLFGCDFTPAG